MTIFRYILSFWFRGFIVTFIALTGIIWCNYSLEYINIITNYGQTGFVFIWITALYIPYIALITVPVAFVCAAVYMLNRLNSDRELVVLHVSGISPWYLFRPFFLATLFVTLIEAFISMYLAPQGLKIQHRLITQILESAITNTIKPGQFLKLRGSVIIHVQERLPDGQLKGIFVNDNREPERDVTYMAERGQVIREGDAVFLALINGTMQSHKNGTKDLTLVRFNRYAINLMQLTQQDSVIQYGVREKYIWELATPDPSDNYFIQSPTSFRNEFHDRITALLYPFVFISVAFALLSTPKSDEKSHRIAIIVTVIILVIIRLVGLATEQLAQHILMYFLIATTCVTALLSVICRSSQIWRVLVEQIILKCFKKAGS
jgi:lipopolysaccharide export system permease protein